MIIIPGQGGTYRHLRSRVTVLIADSGQSARPAYPARGRQRCWNADASVPPPRYPVVSLPLGPALLKRGSNSMPTTRRRRKRVVRGSDKPVSLIGWTLRSVSPGLAGRRLQPDRPTQLLRPVMRHIRGAPKPIAVSRP